MSEEAVVQVPPVKTRKTPAKKRKRLADPFFKRSLTEMALAAGFKHGPTELQLARSTLSDMLLHVPAGIILQATLLAFFRLYNIIEFKGQHDRFSIEAFEVQLGRLHFWHAQNSKLTDLDGVLNVFVVARYPQEIFRYSAGRGSPFTMVDGQEWLWQARCGWQDVVIVVCEKLPVEKPFYQWLAFAPSGSEVWREFVPRLVAEQEWEMLGLLFEMRGKELYAMKLDVEELLAQYDPEEVARLQQEWGEIILDWLPTASPEMRRKALNKFKPEERLSGLKSKEILAGMSETEREQLFHDLEQQFKPAK